MPLVSVVVPTHDRPGPLDRALASARRLERDTTTVELIVVDNGANPETPSVAAKHRAEYLRCANPGAAHSRNAGMAKATGDFIAFLDDDDWWTEEHLAPHLEFLQSHPGFGAVMGRIQAVSQTAEPIGEPYPKTLPENGRVFDALLRDWTQIGAFLTRRTAALAVGPFDPVVEGGEDWEWTLRLAAQSPVALVPVTSLHFSIRDFSDPQILQVNRQRVGCNRRIFWRHARRMHGNVRSLADIRNFMRFRGRYFGLFINVADARTARGDRRMARTALWYALQTSPIHFGVHLLLDSRVRRLTLGARPR